MPEKVTKKQIIQHLKTPYAKLEIGGEEFTENNQHRHNWGFRVWYDYLSIEANPLANAWRVKDYEGYRLVAKRADVIQIASDYIELNRLTWDAWELSSNPKDDYTHPNSWSEIATLLKSPYTRGIFYNDEARDLSFDLYYAEGTWRFSVSESLICIHLTRLTDVMANIRRLSALYCLSASDWCYEV